MTLHCRFSSCQWFGPENEILQHLKTCHKDYLREPKGSTYFDFNFDELLQEAFVLRSTEGLYWFRQNLHQPRPSGIDFGLFHIGESKHIQYTLKLGLDGDDYCEYWSPLASVGEHFQNPDKEKYDLDIDFPPNQKLTSTRFRLYFGDFNDSDYKIHPEPQDMQWSEEDEHVSRLAVERFTCGVCFDNIRPNARFCENQHFICFNCFDEKTLLTKIKCPICRGQYLYDFSDDRILRKFKWTDMEVYLIKSLNDFQEFLETAI